MAIYTDFLKSYLPIFSAILGAGIGGLIAWLSARQNFIFNFKKQIEFETGFFAAIAKTEASNLRLYLENEIKKAAGKQVVNLSTDLKASDLMPAVSSNILHLGKLPEDQRSTYYSMYSSLNKLFFDSPLNDQKTSRCINRLKLEKFLSENFKDIDR